MDYKNLEQAREEFSKLSPEGREIVAYFTASCLGISIGMQIEEVKKQGNGAAYLSDLDGIRAISDMFREYGIDLGERIKQVAEDVKDGKTVIRTKKQGY